MRSQFSLSRSRNYLPAHYELRTRGWLRHFATSWKVAGSIPDAIIGIFDCHNPSTAASVVYG